MYWIGVIVIGFIVGLLARFLKPGPDPMGILGTTLLGIVGSVVASFLGRLIGLYRPEQPAGFIASLVGAIVVLAVAHRFTGSRRSLTTSDRDRWAA
jgi:uncharacterized membrane protein YeaQ/YmgE (transglycosylase-associated protein family)